MMLFPTGEGCQAASAFFPSGLNLIPAAADPITGPSPAVGKGSAIGSARIQPVDRIIATSSQFGNFGQFRQSFQTLCGNSFLSTGSNLSLPKKPG